jgi:hypothetical protein
MAKPVDRPLVSLTARLARLGASLYGNEIKILIAEAVEALHEAETVTQQASQAPEPWEARYKRRMLDHVGASTDVDLDSVLISSGFEEAYEYSEYTAGGGFFAINVSWEEPQPRKGLTSGGPDRDGKYHCSRELTNEEVAAFLDSLEMPA